MQYTLGDAIATDVVFAVNTDPYKEIAATTLGPLSADAAVAQVVLYSIGPSSRAEAIVKSTDSYDYTVESLTTLYKQISKAEAFYNELVSRFSPAEIQAAPKYATMLERFAMITKNLPLIQASKFNPVAASAAAALLIRKRELIEAGNLDPSVFTSEEIATIKAKASAGKIAFSADPVEQKTMVDKIRASANTLGGFTLKQVAIAGAAILGVMYLIRRR